MSCENFAIAGSIERYLAGKLPEPERDAFEQHYFACDRCFEAVRLLRATHEALRTAGAPPLPAIPIPHPTARRRRVWAAVGLTATITTGVLLVTTTRRSTPDRSPASIVSIAPPVSVDIQFLARLDPPPYHPPTLRAGESVPAGRFHAAMAAYAARDFAAAADTLGKIVDADPSSLDARYYFGVCHLLTGRIESAIAELRKVIDAGGTSPYTEQARFYLAKAYLKQGDVDQARMELEKVAGLAGDLRQQAREILNLIPGR